MNNYLCNLSSFDVYNIDVYTTMICIIIGQRCLIVVGLCWHSAVFETGQLPGISRSSPASYRQLLFCPPTRCARPDLAPIAGQLRLRLLQVKMTNCMSDDLSKFKKPFSTTKCIYNNVE